MHFSLNMHFTLYYATNKLNGMDNAMKLLHIKSGFNFIQIILHVFISYLKKKVIRFAEKLQRQENSY